MNNFTYTYTCTCDPSISFGDNCETCKKEIFQIQINILILFKTVNPCWLLPCQHGGSCFSEGSNYTCKVFKLNKIVSFI